MGAGAVEITGLAETRGLLKQFEPDLLKRLDMRLSLVARDLKAGAQEKFEQTGASGTAYQVKTRARVAGFSKAVLATGGSVGQREKWSTKPGVLAAIFEFAAGVRDAKPQNVQRTKSLIATLNVRYGQPGRFLWSAWDERKAVSLVSVDAEIKAVEAEYSKRLRA